MERKAGMRDALRSVLKAGDLALRILLPLLAGYLLALVLIPTPQIAVIRVEGDIWGSYTADISRVLEQVSSDQRRRDSKCETEPHPEEAVKKSGDRHKRRSEVS